jgi:hypothetical protein
MRFKHVAYVACNSDGCVLMVLLVIAELVICRGGW